MMTSIIQLVWNKTAHTISFEFIDYFLFLLVVPILILIIKFIIDRKNNYQITELSVEISGSPKVIFKLKRDYSNLYIANRIYVELMTRKAALPFEKDKDVIINIYESWYTLFSLIRDEMKTISGESLEKKHSGAALVAMTTKILNDGLRPHLTTYQAAFRKWYEKELNNPQNSTLSPQKIQKKYPKYQDLVKNIMEANQVLMDYTNNLKLFIEGK